MSNVSGGNLPNYFFKLKLKSCIDLARTHNWFKEGLLDEVAFERSLRKKCPYSELFWSAFFPQSDWIRRYIPYFSVFSLNAGKCGKNADQNNSEYRHFLLSEFDLVIADAAKEAGWNYPYHTDWLIALKLGTHTK